MNLATIVVLAVVVVCAFFAYKRVRTQGGCSCGHEGNCAGCSKATKTTRKNSIDLNNKIVLK